MATKKSTKEQPATNEHEDINQVNVANYAQQAYLDYAMSVVCGRAIPYLEDGQKPVQRRLLYAMDEMRLNFETKAVKSAKIIGSVLGSYHPHGDQSVYDAMVRQTQNFVMRYPLVHGEGNFGSRDGDSAAAMRYCFTADTRISTSLGLLKIVDIPEILGLEYKDTQEIKLPVSSIKKEEIASKWLFSGVQDVYRIETEHGYSVKCTINEPFYVLDENMDHEWKTVSDLNVGNRVAIKTKMTNDVQSGGHISNVVGAPRNMSSDAATFMGLVAFHGKVKDQLNIVELRFNSLEELSSAKTICNNLFKNIPRQEIIDNGVFLLRIESKTVVDFLFSVGFKFCNGVIESIPEVIYRSSENEVKEFMLVLFNSNKNGSFKIGGNSYKLMEEIKIILLNYFGSISKEIVKDEKNGYGMSFDYGSEIGDINELLKEESILSCLDDFEKIEVVIDEMAELGGKYEKIQTLSFIMAWLDACHANNDKFQIKATSIKEALSHEFLYDKITKIEKLEDKEAVYDLTVENTHAFVANGFIAHNTEAKLSLNSKFLLRDLNSGTVDFRANYDGTTKEPEILPSRLPFVLMNGAEGVAVGMASSIPPHRACEVTNAAIEILKNSNATFESVMEHIPGPDFPTGGQLIQSREKIMSVYKDGNGTLKLRGRWKVEMGQRGAWKLIIYELPYGVSPQRMMEQVDGLFNPKPKEKGNKKEFTPEQLRLKQMFGNMIDAYRDESGKDQPVRVVFESKTSKQNPEDLSAALLAYTSLQETIKFNFVVVGRDRRPAQLGVFTMLKEWTEFRVEVTRRRLVNEQAIAEKRLHIVEGRLKVLGSLQEAIKVIQESDDPKAALMAHFGITEEQAVDVLEMRLRQLARMEGAALNKEKAELEKTIAKLKRLLAKKNELVALVISEMEADLAILGEDARRTIVEEVADADDAPSKTKAISRAPEENITVALSDKFWVRAKSGLEHATDAFVFKTGDPVVKMFQTTSYNTLFGMDHTGRVYNLEASGIPNTRGGEGLPLASVWDLQGKITHAWMGAESDKYILVGNSGQGFVSTGQDMSTRLKAGKVSLVLSENATPLHPIFIPKDISPDASLVCRSSDGSLAAFSLSELPTMGKGKGVAFLGLRDGCSLEQCILIEGKKFGIIENSKTKWIGDADFDAIFGKRSSGKKGKKLSKTKDVVLIAP